MVKSTEDLIGEICELYLAERRDVFYESLDWLGHGPNEWTPIERLMAYALQYALWSNQHFEAEGGKNEFSFAPHQRPYETTDFSWPYGYGVIIYPQMKISKYTADFVVNMKRGFKGGHILGVIECDGHDYHEKTKRQAQHDKQRDRYFQSLGLVVLRYTGSEIWKDPVKCAADALHILHERIKPVKGGAT